MMRILLPTLLCFPFLFFSQTTAKVVGISDGDTITVLLKGNVQKKLRLAEVDCPENRQPFGKNAKKFTSDQVFARQIMFTETDKDRYGRSVAKVYYDNGKYLSAEIIKAGYGWWYYAYSKDSGLGKMQETAKNNKLGLWQDKKAVSPWDFRKQQRENAKKNRLQKQLEPVKMKQEYAFGKEKTA
ncbi:thermonuclease family protein [Chryseobacterium shigense]|uniref:Endonuclease YncB(Thermonuclease family) n=1 Tax=Chryseobacterium shigense TaxID=297244 RepID=A0A841N3H3_9FLAO|nr:thermonuclease family protein [Chryseobacterium shigense]MBB6369693.1 endonuclease YncB(thermonuclease family) [Chryseobacterium shigense]